jgi:hypothetical protein
MEGLQTPPGRGAPMLQIVNRDAHASTAPILHLEWPYGCYGRPLHAPTNVMTMVLTPSSHLAAAGVKRDVRQSCVSMFRNRKHDENPCAYKSRVPVFSNMSSLLEHTPTTSHRAVPRLTPRSPFLRTPAARHKTRSQPFKTK